MSRSWIVGILCREVIGICSRNHFVNRSWIVRIMCREGSSHLRPLPLLGAFKKLTYSLRDDLRYS